MHTAFQYVSSPSKSVIVVKENPERKGKEGGKRERKRKGTWIVIAKQKPNHPSQEHQEQQPRRAKNLRPKWIRYQRKQDRNGSTRRSRD